MKNQKTPTSGSASSSSGRIFAIDVVRVRAFEWARELEAWTILDPNSSIEDPTLAVPLPIEPLVRAIKADDAVAKALRAKRHPEFLAERAEGQLEGRVEMLRKLLLVRFLVLAPKDEARIAEATIDALDRYAERVLTATTIADVFE